MPYPKECDGGTDARKVLEHLASFVRRRALYPANNQRVRESCDALLAALRARSASMSTVQVRCNGTEGSVAGEPVAIDIPNTRWLAETLRKVSLQGVDLEVTVDAATLETFATEVQRCATGTAQPLNPTWPKDRGGLRPVELYIVGQHREDPSADAAVQPSESSAPGGPLACTPDSVRHESELVEELRRNPAIRARIQSLQADLDRHFGSDRVRQEIDLLGRIVELAMSDTAFDMRNAAKLVVQTLESFDTRMISALVETPSAEPALTDVALRVARRYFASQTDAPTALDTSALPAGRPEDEAVIDDLDGLVTEYNALPIDQSRMTFEDDRSVRQHVVDVLVSTLSMPLLPETPARAAARLAKFAVTHSDCDLSTLERCVRAGSRPEEATDRDAILRAFDQAGELELLFARQMIEPETLAAVFPKLFVSWLDLLHPARPNDVAQFHRFLGAVAADPYDDGIADLARSRSLFADKRLEKLVELSGRRAGSILVPLSAAFPEETRQVALMWLSSADLPARESVALRIVPASLVPNDHVTELCRLANGDQSVRDHLLHDAAVLLRRFVIVSADTPALLESRLRAIRALGGLPSSQTRTILLELAKGWSFASAERREVRRAATEALRSIGG